MHEIDFTLNIIYLNPRFYLAKCRYSIGLWSELPREVPRERVQGLHQVQVCATGPHHRESGHHGRRRRRSH